MIHEAEQRADRFAFPVPADSLIGFLAVRLLLERFALVHAAREGFGYDGPLAELRDVLRARLAPPAPPEVEERALPVFLLAQSLGWTPDELHHLSPDEWTALVREVEAFDSVERRRVFHLAYERRFREQTLDALILHPRRPTAGRRQGCRFCQQRAARHRSGLGPPAASQRRHLPRAQAGAVSGCHAHGLRHR